MTVKRDAIGTCVIIFGILVFAFGLLLGLLIIIDNTFYHGQANIVFPMALTAIGALLIATVREVVWK